MIVKAVEVGKRVHTAAGVKRLVGAGGIAALHGSVEQLAQTQRRCHRQLSGHPARQDVIGGGRQRPQIRRRARRQASVEFVDDFEVGDQGAELGGGAEVEHGALVHIEWLVEIVGLHPQVVAVGGALVNDHAVVDVLDRIVGLEQMTTVESLGLRVLGVVQLPQVAVDAVLNRRVEGGFNAEVEPVQGV